MNIEPRKWRTCKSINCVYLDNGNCKVEQCEHPDIGEAVQERIKKLMSEREVNYGGNS